ncbi:MAG: glycosyltransferase family 4 protein [bacterium]
MKKILFFISHPTMGGSQQYILDLVTHLNFNKYIPLIISCFDGEFIRLLEENKIKTFILPMKKEYVNIKKNVKFFNPISVILFFINICKVMLNIYNLIKKEKIDLIYNNNLRCQILSLIPSKLTKIPSLWHIHGFREKIFLHLFLSFFVNKIIVLSEDVKKRLGKFLLNKSKLVVIYNGVNFQKIKKIEEQEKINIRKEIEIEKNDFVIAMIGQLVPIKGYEYFIKSAFHILKEIPNTKFLIVGDEPYYSKGYKLSLQELIEKLNLKKNVIFIEYQKDLFKIISILDIFTLTSIHEHFGRVIIEAMACKIPVIAFNTGGVSEIIIDNKTGFLIEPNNYKKLAKKIIELLKNNEMKNNFGNAGFKRVNELFNLNETIKKVEELFENLGVK